MTASRHSREERAFRPAALARRGRVEPISEALPPPSTRRLVVAWGVTTLLVVLASLLLSHAVTWIDLQRVLLPH